MALDQLFPFTPNELQTWQKIGIIAGAVVGGILFLGGIGGYIAEAIRGRPIHEEIER